MELFSSHRHPTDLGCLFALFWFSKIRSRFRISYTLLIGMERLQFSVVSSYSLFREVDFFPKLKCLEFFSHFSIQSGEGACLVHAKASYVIDRDSLNSFFAGRFDSFFMPLICQTHTCFFSRKTYFRRV